MGLIAGLFYAYACSVMLGLARMDDRTFVDVMQRITVAILNGWFSLSFRPALVRAHHADPTEPDLLVRPGCVFAAPPRPLVPPQQALDRTAPTLPLRPGLPERVAALAAVLAALHQSTASDHEAMRHLLVDLRHLERGEQRGGAAIHVVLAVPIRRPHSRC